MATGIFTSAFVETPLQLLFTYGIITGRDRRILHEGYAPLNYAMVIFGHSNLCSKHLFIFSKHHVE